MEQLIHKRKLMKKQIIKRNANRATNKRKTDESCKTCYYNKQNKNTDRWFVPRTNVFPKSSPKLIRERERDGGRHKDSLAVCAGIKLYLCV